MNPEWLSIGTVRPCYALSIRGPLPGPAKPCLEAEDNMPIVLSEGFTTAYPPNFSPSPLTSPAPSLMSSLAPFLWSSPALYPVPRSTASFRLRFIFYSVQPYCLSVFPTCLLPVKVLSTASNSVRLSPNPSHRLSYDPKDI